MNDVLKLKRQIKDFDIDPLFMIQIITSPLMIYFGIKSFITFSFDSDITFFIIGI